MFKPEERKEIRMKQRSSMMAMIGLAVFAQPAMAQFAKTEDAIKYRQSAMFVMQQNFARVAGMAQGKIPFDAKVAAESAANADAMARMPWAGFVEDSERGGNTKAKAAIWKEKAKFLDSAEKMQVEMGKLNTAAKTGNLDTIKAAVGPVGATCKNCHDAFRE